jgi:hypothetical protein
MHAGANGVDLHGRRLTVREAFCDPPGFGRFDVTGGMGFDLNETEYVAVPADQIDFAAAIGLTEIARYIRYPRFRKSKRLRLRDG